jgi:hypothetical protein
VTEGKIENSSVTCLNLDYFLISLLGKYNLVRIPFKANTPVFPSCPCEGFFLPLSASDEEDVCQVPGVEIFLLKEYRVVVHISKYC